MSYGIFGYDELEVKTKENNWKIKANNGSVFVGKGSKSAQEIRKDFDGHFAFDISKEKQLHFSYKNNYEQMVYYSFGGEKGEVIDFSLEEQEKIIFQRIILTDRINIIALTRKEEGEGWKISFCYKGDEGWSDPVVIDAGWGSGPEKFALTSHNDYLYLFYQVYNDHKYQLVYKGGKDNKWSARNIVSLSENLNISPALTADQKGNLYFSWLRWEKGIFRVMLSSRKKTNGPWIKVGFGKEMYLSDPAANCSSPLLLNSQGHLDVYWQEKEEIKRYNMERKEVESYRKKPSGESTCLVLNLDKHPQIHPYLVETAGTPLFFLKEAIPLKGEEKEREVNGSKEEIEKKQGEIQQLAKELKEKNDLINILKKREEDNQRVVKGLRFGKKREEEKVEKLKEKIKELEQELIRLKQSLEAVKETNTQLRRQLQEKEQEKEKLLQQKKEREEKKRKLSPPFPFGRRI